MAIEDTLANVELFADLAPEDLSRLARVTVVRDHKAGEIIVKEGELGVSFFVVASGNVEVLRGLGTATEQVIGVLGPDSFFGEMALFDNQVRSASVRAKDDCQLFVMTKWDFNAELQASGCRIAIALLSVLARRIRSMNEMAATH